MTGRVLVAGAGPVGMVLAAELLAAGVPVDVVRRGRRDSPHSRATILWPRVLELLDRTGVGARIVERGHYFDQMNYYSDKRRIGRIRFDRLPGAGYPFAITIPQWRTESVLEDHLRALGGEIHEDHELVDGVQEPDGVRVRLRVDGRESEHVYDWVVGADGHDSTVRRVFGFGFDGRALRTRLAITDAEILGEVTGSEAAYYLTRHGNMVLAPLGDGVFRVGASVPHGRETDEPDRAFFETLLRERVPGDKRLGRMNFTGVFVANVRSASEFRRGRVFLAGDAAHVMSPSGAQGLNTGIQDAVNLGWKLAGVATGRYEPGLLDSYDPERRPAVERVSRLSTRLARISLYSTRGRAAARDVAYRIGSATGLLEGVLAPRLAQLDTRYPAPGPSVPVPRPGLLRPLVAGDRVPLGWRPSPAAPVLDADRHTVLLRPGSRYRHEQWVRLVARLRDDLTGVTVHDLGGRPPGPLGPDLGRSPLALVVRPDGHLLAAVPIDTGSSDTPGAAAAVAAVLPSAPPRPVAA